MWTKHLKKKGRQATVITVLIVLLSVAVWADINAGYRQITLAQLWQILTGHGEAGLTYTLIHLRLPRVLTSLLVGVGLAVSGCVIQGVSRNDMAEPGILGINAGAGLFVAGLPPGPDPAGAVTETAAPYWRGHVYSHFQCDHHAHAAHV